jgi:dipeptidyl aminopeptidase/acylaminoacyl peptidase
MAAYRLAAASIALSALVLGCSSASPTATTATTAPVPPSKVQELIPRRVLWGLPGYRKHSPTLSPDGKNIAFIAPFDGQPNVWVAPTGDITKARLMSDERKRGIKPFVWAFDNRHLLYVRGSGRELRGYSVDVVTGKKTALTPRGAKAQIQGVSRKHPHIVLFRWRKGGKRAGRSFDLYKVDLRTNESTLAFKNEQNFEQLITDDDFEVRVATKENTDGDRSYLMKKGDEFEPLMKLGWVDARGAKILSFGEDGQTMYMFDSRGRDKVALLKMVLPDGKPEVIAEDPEADAREILLHPTKATPQAFGAKHARMQWQFLDPQVKQDWAVLSKLGRGDVKVVSHTSDDRKWTVELVPDDGPVRYYLYDRDTKKASFLFVDRKELEGLKLAQKQIVEIKARDGLSLVTYITLPAHIQADRPPKPLPMVLFVHGGPWSRSRWDYSAHHQWLSNRGYAVMSVNFRGSRGLGKKFTEAADHEWSGKMQTDLYDAVDWAVAQGIADKDKVAVMGASYGGYVALVGLTFEPKRFACGIETIGSANLVTMLEATDWGPKLARYKQRVGDHTTEEGRKALLARSPLPLAHKIERPLLIGQAEQDPRAPAAESMQLIEAMQKNKVPVTYAVFPDEGGYGCHGGNARRIHRCRHGLRRSENAFAFNAISEAFLGTCLGGAVQPIRGDLIGSSVTVPIGSEHIPGLPPL